MAVRGSGQCAIGSALDPGHVRGHTGTGSWELSIGYRWLETARHFVGDRDINVPDRYRVVNRQSFLDLSARRDLNQRFSIALTVPLVNSQRSTVYEHDGRNRHTTRAGGLGDVRLTGYFWAFDPLQHPEGNLALGFGLKFPSGDYSVEDTFHTASGPIRRPVDQSIQPGDGGYGYAFELIAFRQLRSRLGGYLQGFYLLNPRNENGTETDLVEGGEYERTMSVTDQYLGRIGLSYLAAPAWGLAVDLGGRIEGVPVSDAVGESKGFRRPGYAVSVEPGVTVVRGEWTLTLAVPVAVYRNRLQSLGDRQIRWATGEDVQGDAAFADYVITVGVARRI